MKLVKDLFCEGEDVRTFESSHKLALGRCFVGVELEIERCPQAMELNYKPTIGVRSDGTLRGGSSYEVVSIPLMGKDLLNHLKIISELEGRFSNRTSVHIHLDVRNLDVNQLEKLIKMYAMLEGNLYGDFIKEDRKNSHYAKPLFVTKGVYLNSDISTDHYKYCAINLGALIKFGTLEFRALHGTNDYDTLLKWINYLLKLKKLSRTVSIKTFESNYVKLLGKFSPFSKDISLTDISNYNIKYPFGD